MSAGLEINTSLVKPLVPRTGAAAVAESPASVRARVRQIMLRMKESLKASGGIERSDFLDLSNMEFRHTVYTLWWGRQYA